MITGMSANTHDRAETAPDIILLSSNPSHVRGFQSVLKSIGVIHAVKARIHDAAAANPSLVIIDAQDSGGDPLHLLKQVRAAVPQASLILVNTNPDATTASRAMRSGASAFLAASEIESLLETAIKHVRSGTRFVSEAVMQGILHGMVDSGDTDNRVPVEALSDREMMIFQLLGKGASMTDIARELDINIKTVSTHCHNIRCKLSIPDNNQLAQTSRTWIEGQTGPAASSHSIVASGKQ